MKSRFNLATLLLLALTLALPSALLAQGGGNQNRGNRLLPVLIYTVSSVGDGGGSDAANLQVQSALIVYSNGQAVFLGGDENTAANSACNVTLGGEQIRNLQRELRRGGAQRLSSSRQGQPGGSGDTMVTVTFFINNQNANQSVANSFSYFVDSASGGNTDDLGSFGRFESSIQSFLAGNFGSCNGGGSGGFGG